MNLRRFLRRLLAGFLLALAALSLVAYLADWAVFRYRVARNRQPYGQVMVDSYDAVAQKNGKTQYIFNPPQAETCSNSLFPQAGNPPCWYLRKHREQRTDI